MEIGNSKMQWKSETAKCDGNQKQQNAMEIRNSKMQWKKSYSKHQNALRREKIGCSLTSETAKCNGKILQKQQNAMETLKES